MPEMAGRAKRHNERHRPIIAVVVMGARQFVFPAQKHLAGTPALLAARLAKIAVGGFDFPRNVAPVNRIVGHGISIRAASGQIWI